MPRETQGWTRREWLQMAAAGMAQAATAGQQMVGAAGSRVWGVQLYTVRDQMKDEASKQKTLEAIAAIGYKEVEVLHPGMAETCRIAQHVGLSPVSLHIEAPVVTGDWSAWRDMARQTGMPLPPESYGINAIISEAQPLGFKYLVVSYLMPAERARPGFLQTFADAMNKAGDAVSKAGMQLCYHNHAFEFEKQPDGRTGLEALASGFDKQLVKFELDVFWVSIAGGDPAALLRQYAGRVALVHLKDKANGTPRETNEAKVSAGTFKEIGRGSLEFPAILEAATAAGVQHYFVEQDHTPGDPLASLKTSFEYLQHLA
jgi:sugar phosphate isomerase/epimerase